MVHDTVRQKASRDYIMVKLRQQEFVKKHELQQDVKLPPDVIEAMLVKMCVSTPNGWKLKLPPDEDFIAK